MDEPFAAILRFSRVNISENELAERLDCEVERNRSGNMQSALPATWPAIEEFLARREENLRVLTEQGAIEEAILDVAYAMSEDGVAISRTIPKVTLSVLARGGVSLMFSVYVTAD